MKFKLDENFGTRTQSLFVEAGHDVHTVAQEGLSGAEDTNLFELCCSESRCLVTLDLDFADVVRFPPQHANGIVVIRAPRNPSLPLLETMVQRLLDAINRRPLESHLWIVEPNRIRIHQKLE